MNIKNRAGKFNSDFFIKCGFSFENIQPLPIENEQPIKNSRYWLTEVHQTKSFNDFIYFNFRDSVLKGVVNNGLAGSSWHLNCFLYINVKILRVGEQLFW